MKHWIYRKFFRKERAPLIKAIQERESVIRNRNKTIEFLRGENRFLWKELKDLKEILAVKVH